MSESNSPVSSGKEDREEVDIDLLIAEVKIRPTLYIEAKTDVDKEKRQKLWTEVCQAIFKEWNDFDQRKKEEKAKDVEAKWRILRDTFYKKFGGAYTFTSSGKKKRKYYYFNSLSFLIPTMEETADAIPDNNNETENAFAEVDEQARRKTPGINNVLPSMSTQTIPPLEQPWQFPEMKTTSEMATAKTTQEKDEENTHFALMLVPMMRRFNDDQLFQTRIAILRIMKQISQTGQEKISILQNELKYSAETLDSGLMPDLNYPVPEEAPFDDGQEYPVPAPIVEGRPTNPQGEIQYPETDPEDVDV